MYIPSSQVAKKPWDKIGPKLEPWPNVGTLFSNIVTMLVATRLYIVHEYRSKSWSNMGRAKVNYILGQSLVLCCLNNHNIFINR